MALTEQSLKSVISRLAQSDYDVAAGLSEATIGDFLDAHWKTESQSSNSVYKGEGRAQELGLTWSYDVARPASIDLLPIAPQAFARIYGGWMQTVPELARFTTARRALGSEKNEVGTLIDAPPPNVQIAVPEVRVSVRTDSGIKVDFVYAVTITGFVETDVSNGQRVLRITPIAAKVTEPAKLIASVRAALPSAALTGATDCVALEKLILYLLNVLIANRIGAFIRQFSLPVPVDVVKGVTIGDAEVEIVDDLLVVKGRLAPAAPVVGAEQRALDNGDHDQIMQFAAVVAKAPQSLIEAAAPLPVRTLGSASALASWPARGIFVILHERLFQAFAATVGYQTSGENCKSLFGLKGCLGYALRAWGATATVTDKGLRVAAQFAGGGWLRVCVETHCGDKCHKVSADARGRPNFDTIFTINGRDLWMSAEPGAFDVSWHIGGLPWPLNRLIEWALDQLTAVALLFARVMRLQWQRQLTSFPAEFPGTTLRYTPSLDRQILRDPSQPALMILGEVDFLS